MRALFRLLLLLFSLLLAGVLAEGALRLWFRDGGRATLSGPGGRAFLHDTVDGELRGRRDVGAKTVGVPRIMVVGDSITYGQGIKDWRLTWPELLVKALEARGRPHQLAVFAFPGQDIPGHVDVVRQWAERVNPDVFIYQWYVNDIEAMSHRPDLARPWQRTRLHHALREWSYAYFVLDHRLTQIVAPPTRSYVDYLLSDFAPGTIEWAEFERQFHELAVRAAHVAPKRVMVLYPQVPFGDRYPLAVLHERMRSLARAHDLEIPPSVWIRSGGQLQPDATAPWKQAFSGAPGMPAVIETPEYLVAGGMTRAVLTLQHESGGPEAPGPSLEWMDLNTGQVGGRATVTLEPGAGWRSVTTTLSLPGDALHRVRFRVNLPAPGKWKVARLALPVDYGFEVLDLAGPLNLIDTHVSPFDAHPNVAAQQLMADELLKALTR